MELNSLEYDLADRCNSCVLYLFPCSEVCLKMLYMNGFMDSLLKNLKNNVSKVYKELRKAIFLTF